MGTGKHSALKQSDDGSFELVVSDEPEVEAEAPVVPEPARSPKEPEPTPGGLIKWAVLAAVLLGVGVVVALIAGGSDDSSGNDEDTPAGFKPYVGDEQQAESAIVPVDPVRPSKPARRAVSDDEPEEEEVEVDEMAEVDEAWKLEESGEEIVESEEVPPDFMDQVVQIEGDGEEGEIEEGRDGTKFVNPKTLENIRQRIQKDVEIRKTLPNLDVQSAPQIRPTRISPGNATGPANADDITVIEEDELEEIPEE